MTSTIRSWKVAVFILCCYLALMAIWMYQQYSGKTRHSITPSQIFVWSYVPPTPCRISVDNPDCTAGSIKGSTAGDCSNEAVCHPLNAMEFLRPAKKIIATEYWVCDGNVVPGSKARWIKCSVPFVNCSIENGRWDGMAPGYGRFKNWSGTTGRTAVVVANLADR